MRERVAPVIKNSLVTVVILLLSTALCFVLQKIASTDTHVPLIFVLAVLFVSRFTDGYRYGVIAAMVAVVGVNYIFTYPYFQIDFTITGYPITFLAMLAVAISVSALTTQIKKQEQMRLEVEKEKMRANLLRAVSHDIRTPLTSIAGSAAGILDNQEVLSSEKVLDLVSNIKEEAEWMVRMVIAAMVAVVGVNYIFTYPYFQIDFTITGYPITFLAMLAVAISVSALTTQIKKQEQMRLEVEKEKMRANLLRAVSHDIRTPLTSIAGSAAGILDNQEVLSSEKVLDLVSNIKEEAEWMVRMVENLLSITRMNTENAKIDTREELVEEVVSGSVVKFQKRFPEIQVVANIPDEVLLVPMDVILIEQVIVNLMENSVVHGRATEIQILVERKKREIVFRVKDNGSGIEPEVLPHMFDGSIGSSAGEPGDSKRNMGIGLSVCKSIVKAHKGNMQAANNKEGGASVSFTIPFEGEES